jgi:hypothetical protein
MVLESGLTHKAKFLKEIGIWEYSNDQFIIYLMENLHKHI